MPCRLNVKVTIERQMFSLDIRLRSISPLLFKGFSLHFAIMFRELKRYAVSMSQSRRLKVKFTIEGQ